MVKKIFFVVLISYVSLIIHGDASSISQCINDTDWPAKPCLDTPPYTESQLKQVWDQYYELKGDAWMKMKKLEMDYAIQHGILKEWYEYGKNSNNLANSNVWNYYHVYGQAPDISAYYNNVTTKNDFVPIITYYYTSIGAILLIGGIISLAGVGGFFIYQRISFQKNPR